MVRLETLDLGYLWLGLCYDARDTSLHSEGLKRSCVELFGDNPECSFLTAFQLVQSGWDQLGLPGWGSVVDYLRWRAR